MKLLPIATLALALGLTASGTARAGYQLQFVPNPAANETPPTNDSFGTAIVATETSIFVGCPNDSTKAVNAGAIYQYEIATGKLIRKIYGYTPAANHRFGTAIATSGNLLAVGAPGFNNGGGVITWHDVATGAVKGGTTDLVPGTSFGSSIAMVGDVIVAGRPDLKIAPTDAHPAGGAIVYNIKEKWAYFLVPAAAHRETATNNTGCGRFSVALSGTKVLVGAPDYDGGGSSRGAVYVFDYSVRSGAHAESQSLLTKGSPADLDRFGLSIVSSGPNVLIGCPGGDSVALDAGDVFHYNIPAATLSSPITIPGASAGDAFGSSLAVNGNFVVLGAPNRQQMILGSPENVGAALALDISDNFALLGTYSPIVPKVNGAFGRTVAIGGGTVVVGGLIDGAANQGTVYGFGPLRTPPPWNEITRRGNAAPGRPGSFFGSALQMSVRPTGAADILAGINGAVAAKGILRTDGVISSIEHLTGTTLPLATGTANNADLTTVVANDASLSFFVSKLSGTGVTKTNDMALYSSTGSGTTPTLLMRKGDVDGTSIVSSFSAPYAYGTSVQTMVKLAKGTVAPLKTADSKLVIRGGVMRDIREGSAPDPLVPTTILGEISALHSRHTAHGYFIAAMATTAVTNQALFSTALLQSGSSAAPLLLRGQPLPGTASVSASAFLGVTQNASHYLTRLKLNVGGNVSGGDIITAKDAECLYANTAPGDIGQIVVRVGRPVTGLPQGSPVTVANSMTIKQFLDFALLDDDTTVTRVVLQGPGVKKGNDIAILAIDTAGAAKVLLRTGDAALGAGGGTIGVISNWAVSRSGQFVAVATVAGATAGTDLVLVSGDSADASLDLITRKGMIYDTEGSERVKSIALPAPSAAAAGVAGGALLNGSPELVAPTGQFYFSLTFDDNREVLYQR